jgi:hypothetical protein
MTSEDPFFRKTENYRVLIDTEGIGHIRIIKRINFRTLLVIVKDLYLELRKNPEKKPHIVIYISRSLCSEMSDNMDNFLDFAVSCVEGSFELNVIE